MPRYFSGASSDQGSVRPNNEDRVYCDEARGFFLVVDGMGGHEAGEQAAEIAVERIRARLERQTDSVEQRLREAITLANNAIYEAAQEKPEWKGMACVLTAAVIDDGQVIAGHVGDSRLYKIRRGAIEKITRDHSPIGEREDRGELSEAEAMQHPRRNEVYRDVGSEEHSPDDDEFIEIFKFAFEPDMAFLLCSDGLSDAIHSENILRIVEQNAGRPDAAARALIAAANKVGKDNVSAVLVEGNAFGRRPAKGRKKAVAADVSVGETTDRLTAISAETETESHWYRSAPAYLIYGAIVGAVLTLSIQILPVAIKKAGGTAQPVLVTLPGTIAGALVKARPGDTITVAPGIYAETVRLKEGITLIAQRPREAVIQGPVEIEGIHHARLEGFQIIGGEPAIRVKNSDVILARDEILKSRSAGVEFIGNSRGAIFACDIHNNAGPGIIVLDTAAPFIENNVISENGVRPDSLRPGILVRSNTRPFIAGNIFSGNGAEPVWLPVEDEAIAQRNSFTLAGKADERPKFRVLPQEGHP